MEPGKAVNRKVVGSSPSSGASFEFRADNDGTVVMILSLPIGRGSRTFRSNLPPAPRALNLPAASIASSCRGQTRESAARTSSLGSVAPANRGAPLNKRPKLAD
jgi:hypothetical protein